MRKLLSARRALVSALVFQVIISLTAANYGLAAPVTGGQQEEDFAKPAAVDKPLVDETGKQQPPASANNSVETEASVGASHEEPLPEQTEDSDSSSKKAWIYGGLGAAAVVGIVAVAASSGGGSSSAPTTPADTTPTYSGNSNTSSNSDCRCRCQSEPGKWACPAAPYFVDSSGECHESLTTNTNPRSPVANNPNTRPVCADLSGQWSGMIDLTGNNGESVTATITQDGGKLQITTSSKQSYGQVFIGEIDSSCHILNYEQKTGQDWSTNSGPANANSINLYDYVDVSCHGYTRFDRLFLTR